VDRDAVGHPGATALARAPSFSWVQVDPAQGTHPLLDGRGVDRNRIEGTLEVRFVTHHVPDASNRLFVANPTSRVIPEESCVTMVRVPDGTTCEANLERLDIDPGW
jgi:hypothetical protein